MKIHIKTIAALAAAGLGFISCGDDFLSTNPDLRTTLDSEEKIASILVAAYTGGAGDYEIFAELSSDNVADYGSTKNYNQFYQDVYEWDEEVVDSGNDAPYDIWSANYTNIANANQALYAIDELGGATTSSLQASKGEALLCRAYSHFILANLFCMPYYSAESAENYLGIPYMDHAETELNPTYERGTLKEVYDKMGEDIEEGIPLIDDNSYSVPKYHFNYKAACTFASRYYLFIKDWDKAIEYATMALTSNPSSQLRDYDAISELPNGMSRHQQYGSSSETANYMLSAPISAAGTVFGWYTTCNRYSHAKVQATYETTDCRAPWGTVTFKANRASLTGGKYVLPRIYYDFQYTDAVAGTGYARAVTAAITSEEAFLNRAEAYIMKGDLQSGLDDMNMVFKNMISTASFSGMTVESINNWITNYYPTYSELYVGTTSTTSPQTLNPRKHLCAYPYNTLTEGSDQDNVLQALIFLRRYQFLHTGMRWFDTRRYGITVYRYEVDEDALTVTRITDTISDESGTPDLRRALQLPSDVISAGLEANPRN